MRNMVPKKRRKFSKHNKDVPIPRYSVFLGALIDKSVLFCGSDNSIAKVDVLYMLIKK